MIIGPYRAGPGTFETPVHYVVPRRWHLILPECSSNLSSNMRPDYKKIDTTNYFLRLPPKIAGGGGSWQHGNLGMRWKVGTPLVSLQHFTETFNHYSFKFLNVTTIETTVQVYQPTDTPTKHKIEIRSLWVSITANRVCIGDEKFTNR